MRLTSLRQGDHVCAVYESPERQLSTVASYIALGLRKKERCIYIVDDRSMNDVRDALTAHGVGVAAAESENRLVLLTKRETYLKNGSFDPDQMIWALSALTDQAISDGCTGLRVTGEMTWALGTETGCDRLLEYEAKLNQFFPASRAHAICQYNQSRFSSEIIEEILRRHPLAVIGDRVYQNPFYEPEDLAAPGANRVAHMINQITRNRTH